jgi:hypothetical protein
MWPSNDFNSVADMSRLGYPKAFQQEMDMIQVKAPSSTIV